MVIPLIEIPPVFQSELRGARFEHCVRCDRNLFESMRVYQIEKAFRDGQLIYEYAMCSDCLEWFDQSLSEVSRDRLGQFMDNRVDFDHRRKTLSAISPLRVKPWIGRCVVTDNPICEGDEYQLFGHGMYGRLMMRDSPYALSGEVAEEMLALMSEQSREQLDRFTRDCLKVPPEMLKRPTERQRLVH